VSDTTSRRGSGRRVPTSATYYEKAEAHSERLASGCWRWLGTIHGGTPHVYARPGGGERRVGLVNLRASLLDEAGVGRPADSGPARVTCDEPLCVNPGHLEWTPRIDHRLALRSVQRPTLSLDEVREAYLRREAGEPVTSIARSLGIARQNLYRQWKVWLVPDSPLADLLPDDAETPAN
jgi:hypothetical protein